MGSCCTKCYVKEDEASKSDSKALKVVSKQRVLPKDLRLVNLNKSCDSDDMELKIGESLLYQRRRQQISRSTSKLYPTTPEDSFQRHNSSASSY